MCNLCMGANYTEEAISMHDTMIVNIIAISTAYIVDTNIAKQTQNLFL